MAGKQKQLFLAFLVTVLSQPFFPFVGCDFMSLSFLSAGHAKKIFNVLKYTIECF
jgi:hypothetical protein